MEEKNYQNYRFKQDEVLNLSSITLDRMTQFTNQILEKEVQKLTPIKYDLIHKTTKKLAPKKLSEVKRKEYDKIPNIQKTMDSSAVEYLTEEARAALTMQFMLSEVRVKNVDLGKGIDVVKEAEDKAKELEIEKAKESSVKLKTV